jgi:hypothetical protein
MTLKKIDGNIKRVVTNGQKLNVLIHETAVLIANHAKEHGDCTRALTLVKAMPASMRRTMLIKWFDTFTPIRVLLAADKVGILKDTAKTFVPFDVEAGDAKPFYELAEETPEKEYSFDKLVAMVEQLGKAIEKKVEAGKVPANDVAGALSIAETVKALRFQRPAAANA